MDFDYSLEPGKVLEKKDEVIKSCEPTISIITPFYSGQAFLEQLANSILNQTYPYFEWLIINDGVKDEESMNLLKRIKKMDSRIKVFHKENSGPAATRDYGASVSSECTKYLFFIDDDDLIEKTYLECAYWTLETNTEASFAYSDCVGFGTQNYTWARWFNLEEEKKENMLVLTALIRKKDFFSVGGYGLTEKAINEDWIFWLKMFSNGKIPVRMSYYAFWYRRKEQGELKLSKQKKNQRRTNGFINKLVKKIDSPIEAIQYPRVNYEWDDVFRVNIENLVLQKYKDNGKIKILMIIPWITMGGADKFNLDLISRIDKEKYEITVVTTEPAVNKWRQKMEQSAKVIYDLSTFLDRKYWPIFIKYIIESRNINIIFNTNSICGYEMLPYLKSEFPNIPIIDYIHMEEWYNRNGGYSRDSSAVSSVIDRTLTCNKKSADILVDYFKVDKNKVDTVYIGVDEKKFNIKNCDIKSLKNKYDIPNDKFIINFICRIDYQKRPILFIKIMRELFKKRKDFICLVAGNGPLLEKLKGMSKIYNLDDNLRFLGAVKNTEEIYAISDLSLNCSIKEGLALTSYESLSMSVPVVTSDVGGQAELIDSSVGAVVPCIQEEYQIYDFNYSKEEISNYVNEIINIMDNKEKYKKDTRNKILSGFTIDHMVSNMTKEFGKLSNVKSYEHLTKNKDIYLELINQFFLNDNDRYSYLCEDFNCTTFNLEAYKNGWTTSKFKLAIILFIKKIGLAEEFRIIRDIFKLIIKFLKTILMQIIGLFKKLFRVGSEKNEDF